MAAGVLPFVRGIDLTKYDFKVSYRMITFYKVKCTSVKHVGYFASNECITKFCNTIGYFVTAYGLELLTTFQICLASWQL